MMKSTTSNNDGNYDSNEDDNQNGGSGGESNHGRNTRRRSDDDELRASKQLALAGPIRPPSPAPRQTQRSSGSNDSSGTGTAVAVAPETQGRNNGGDDDDLRTSKPLSLAGPRNPHPPSTRVSRRRSSNDDEDDDYNEDDETAADDNSSSMQPGAHRVPGRYSDTREASARNVTNTGSLVSEEANSAACGENGGGGNGMTEAAATTMSTLSARTITPPNTPTVAVVAKVVEERELAMQYCEEKMREIELRESKIIQHEKMMFLQQQKQHAPPPPPPPRQDDLLSSSNNSIPPITAAANAMTAFSSVTQAANQPPHLPVVMAQSVTPIIDDDDDDIDDNTKSQQRHHRKSKSNSIIPTRLLNALRGSGTRRASSSSPQNSRNLKPPPPNSTTAATTNDVASTTRTQDAATAAQSAVVANAPASALSPTVDNNDTVIRLTKETVVWCWKETPSQMVKHNKSDIWGDRSEYWIKYDAKLNNEIEQAYNNKTLIHPNGDYKDYLLKGLKGYKINFTSMHQTKIKTEFAREIQRCIVTTTVNNNTSRNGVVSSFVNNNNNGGNSNTNTAIKTTVARAAKQIATFDLIDNGTVVWCWKETSVRINNHSAENVFSKEHGWIRYEKEASHILERAYQSPDITECVPLKGYKVVFVRNNGGNNTNSNDGSSMIATQMKQIKLSTRYERDVLRFCMDREDDNNGDNGDSATMSGVSV